MNSIFTPLAAQNLTSLFINYNWRNDTFTLSASKDWGTETSFKNYNQTFYASSNLTTEAKSLNHTEVLALFEKHNLTEYLEEIMALIRKGKHHGIFCFFHQEKNIRFMCNQHSPKRGINNKMYAQYAGGIRRHPLEEQEKDVIIDGLNLGRAMSLKNIVADVPFGGSKITVHMDELDLNDDESLGFLAYAMDRSQTMTSPDMRLPVEMSDIIAAKYSKQFIGGPAMPLGTTGKPTAYGLYVALKQAVRFKENTESLEGKTILLQGLGAVGWYAADHFLEENAILLVSERNPQLVSDLIAKHPQKKITDVSDQDVIDIEADIFCPCAMGGFIDEAIIERMKFKYVFGAANNQLKATSDAEEIVLAQKMADKDILFQTDFVQNAAGVICGSSSYIYGQEAKYEKLLEAIDKVMPAMTYDNLVEAKAKNITPTENIYQKCQAYLYGE